MIITCMKTSIAIWSYAGMCCTYTGFNLTEFMIVNSLWVFMGKACWKTTMLHLHAAVNLPTWILQRNGGTSERTRKGRQVKEVKLPKG